MADGESGSGATAPRKRADARRNEATLLNAAAAAFVESGVNVPVRDIAARSGVGVGTIYRHFPTRADLIVALYRHQIEACAEAGPVLLAERDRPHEALARWIGMFVDFLVTKHGLAEVLRSDAAFQALHAYFIDRLVPVCGQLLEAAAAAGEIPPAWMPTNCFAVSGISASGRAATLATTPGTWSSFSSPDCASSRRSPRATTARSTTREGSVARRARVGRLPRRLPSAGIAGLVQPVHDA